jgi:hypothetical protein
VCARRKGFLYEKVWNAEAVIGVRVGLGAGVGAGVEQGQEHEWEQGAEVRSGEAGAACLRIKSLLFKH